MNNKGYKRAVIPAPRFRESRVAGIQRLFLERHWVPAFAGTTSLLE